MLHTVKRWIVTLDRTRLYILIGVVLLGCVLRFYAMTRGHNFDFESYKIVGDIVTHWGNVYAETTRYNYGPVWFSILGFFREIAILLGHPDVIFRILIVGLLTAVDLVIAALLYKKYGIWAFVIFFLNPISIVITGYHNQFDNLAVLIGLLGLLVMPKVGSRVVTKQHVYAALLIGLSLMTKHIFFILPIWFFIRETHLKVKMFMTVVPLALFGIGFLPFLFNGGADGILHNVFLYKSFANAPLLMAFASPGIIAQVNPTILMIGALLVTGVMTRKLPIFEAGLWYLLVLVAFAPAIANQYLAIAMPAIAALGVVFFVPFIILSSILLVIVSTDGMHIERLSSFVPERILPFVTQDPLQGQYKLIIATLFVGMVLLAVYRYRRKWYKDAYKNIRVVVNEQLRALRK